MFCYHTLTAVEPVHFVHVVLICLAFAFEATEFSVLLLFPVGAWGYTKSVRDLLMMLRSANSLFRREDKGRGVGMHNVHIPRTLCIEKIHSYTICASGMARLYLQVIAQKHASISDTPNTECNRANNEKT